MKAILRFDLPEEAEEHQDAVNGSKWKMIVREIDSRLRDIEKYGSEPRSATEIRKMLRDAMDDECLWF